MPFTIIRGDITQQRVDAIVNSANPKPIVGHGVDSGIHAKAGPELLEARKLLGPIPVGSAAITLGYRLKARFVIHAVGPLWVDGNHGEARQLRECYDSALQVAEENGCRSVAFPLIAAGNYGFPRAQALEIALNAFSSFLMTHDMQITLVVFGNESFRLSGRVMESVVSFIDDNYVRTTLQEEYDLEEKPETDEETFYRIRKERYRRRREEEERFYGDMEAPSLGTPVGAPSPILAPEPAAPRLDLKAMMDQMDAGFSQTLLMLIDRTGKKDPEIYRKANVDRKLFSKIRKNPNYHPSKPVALAFALALELNLEEAKDLIGRAGFALSHSSAFDIIVEWAIQNRQYNIMEVNAILFEYDQPQLG